MLEILNHPAFYPALYGFLGGAVLVWLISAIRLAGARARASAAEKAAGEKVAAVKSEKSTLEDKIATLRTNESRLMKHQGQLEGLAKSDDQRQKDLAVLTKTVTESLVKSLAGHEKAILDAIENIKVTAPVEPSGQSPIVPAAPEDLDFVPLENLPGATEDDAAEQKGAPDHFVVDQTDAKAESAANVFREALKGKNP